MRTDGIALEFEKVQTFAAHMLALHYRSLYSPDLNPAEGIWSLPRYQKMADHNIDQLGLLHHEAEGHLRDIGENQILMRSCFQGAGLATML